MNDEQYFALDYLSQSRLGVVKCLRDGLDLFKASKESLEFGTQFHYAVLQPELYAEKLRTDKSYQKNKYKIAEMVKACKDNSLLVDLLASPGPVEHSHTFQEPRYGLDCKIKMDKFIPTQKTILDLKSTACKTLQDFEETITKYRYHAQGAFYLDGAECDRFILIGVSKSYPHKTFTVILNFDHELIEQGRQENDELIDHYLSMPEKPDFKTLMEAA